jgi:hypothetical protein
MMRRPSHSVTAVFLAVCAVAIAEVLTSSCGKVNHYRQPRPQSRGGDWCLVEEDCIVEAVYRYEIKNSEGHSSSALFFLSRGEGRDPADEVINRLGRDSFRVKAISKSVDAHTAIKDKETGEAGVRLSLGALKRVNETTFEVEGSAYSGWGDVKGYVYHLTLGENGWAVSERKFVFES